jgi:hypothetical protein
MGGVEKVEGGWLKVEGGKARGVLVVGEDGKGESVKLRGSHAPLRSWSEPDWRLLSVES